jgi:hypothetical protein
VSESVDHFAAQGAIYRRRVDGQGPLVAIAGGLPAWIDGIADTGCIATHGATVVLADRKGNLYVSADAGRDRPTASYRRAAFSSSERQGQVWSRREVVPFSTAHLRSRITREWSRRA